LWRRLCSPLGAPPDDDDDDVCLQKAAETLVSYRSDGLVTAIKQECLKMSFKTTFRIAQDDFFEDA